MLLWWITTFHLWWADVSFCGWLCKLSSTTTVLIVDRYKGIFIPTVWRCCRPWGRNGDHSWASSRPWSTGRLCSDIEHPYRCVGVSSSSAKLRYKSINKDSYNVIISLTILHLEVKVTTRPTSKDVAVQWGNLTFQDTEVQCDIAELSDYSALLLMPAILFKSHTVIYNSEYEYGEWWCCSVCRVIHRCMLTSISSS